VPRRKRIEIAGAYYHVTTRGNNKQPIYLDDRQRRFHLWLIDRTARKHGWQLYAYCLMANHFHLVLRLSDGGLARGMCELNGTFSRVANLHSRRQDHLFGKRYWAGMLETDAHLPECCRYVVLNPCRAGVCTDPAVYRWSSFRASAGLENPPPSLAVGELWGLFSRRPDAARDAYRQFVRAGHLRCQAP